PAESGRALESLLGACPYRRARVHVAGTCAGAVDACSEVARLGRRMHPIIVAAVRVTDWQRRELRIRQVVEAGDGDRDELAADLRNISPHERSHAALLAKQVMALPGGELVVR